jgi:glycosyltransferase involved in cell wall biosynthesis
MGESMTHISVMVPVYNRAGLIGFTLESLLNQSHTDLDITVIDDASTDKTVEIVEKYLIDSRVSLIKNTENLGLTKNWNRCLELAQGPLVQIMQSDDLIDADYLERVNRIFEEHPEVGFVSAACRYIDAQGQVIGSPADRTDCIFRAGDDAVTAILTLGFPHVSSIIMRRTALSQMGKINEEIWHGPDVEFDARLASKFNYYKIGKVSTSFRRHGTNRGNLEYVRKDYLPVHILKFKLAWSCLSVEGRKKLGIHNLSDYINNNASQMAIGGAIVMIAYGKPDMGKFYLRKAVELNPTSIFRFGYWKAFFLNLFPFWGERIMARRLNISKQDLKTIKDSKLQ